MKYLLVLCIIKLVAGASIQPPKWDHVFAQYSGELYNEVSKENPGSFVICTPSIQNGLGMIYFAAKGASAKQISTSLHFPDDKIEFQELLQTFSKDLQSPKNGDYILNNANKVYIDTDLEIAKDYKQSLEHIYDAHISKTDFSKKAQAAAEINSWIEDKTHHKIQNMVKEDQLDAVRAALVNAVYFQGKWVHEFNSANTKNMQFHVTSEIQKSVEMMNMAGHFSYYESPTLRAQFLKLPYKGEGITMTFVLPIDKQGLSELESHMTDIISEQEFKEERIIMAIPKFKVDTSINLIPVLKKLGVTDIFSNNADLTGMTENKEDLKIGTALQKAVIEVDEKGTIATAAFVGFAVPMSSHYVPPPTYYFTADHPFIYYIKVNNIVLFIGRYTAS